MAMILSEDHLRAHGLLRCTHCKKLRVANAYQFPFLVIPGPKERTQVTCWKCLGSHIPRETIKYLLEIDPDLQLTTEEECKIYTRMTRFGRWEGADWWIPNTWITNPEERILREGYIILRRKFKNL